MTRVTATPTSHQVYNELDRIGLLLNLVRLTDERNPEYKQRLMDVFVHRANSTYQGLINGVTRELGLSVERCMSVEPVVDSNGDTLLANPGIEFLHTQCFLYRDYMSDDILLTIDRYDPDGGAWTLGELVSTINATGYFTASLEDGINSNHRSMTIFNQASLVIVPSEELSGSGSRIVLGNTNLIENTVTITSPNLTNRVSSETAITNNGDYYINHKAGVIIAQGAPAPGSTIRYVYRVEDFIAESSPIIINNLQSGDFKRYMFQTAEDTEGIGLPTPLGADILNELLSVFPSTYGP